MNRRRVRVRKPIRSVVLAAFVVGALGGPASADTVTIATLSGLEDADGVDIAGNFTPGEHAGVVKITLSRKRADGTWRKIKTKTATEGYPAPGYFIAFFNKVKGNKTCRGKAVFTAPEHEPVTKRTVFDC